MSDTNIKFKNRYIPSEMDRNIKEPGDNNIKSCNFNDVLRLEFAGALPRVTSSKSIGRTNTMHLMAVIEYYISSIKG